MKVEYFYQLRALRRWEFEYEPSKRSYYAEIDDLKICWSIENQTGAYYFNGELCLIKDWENLDDIMSNTEIY